MLKKARRFFRRRKRDERIDEPPPPYGAVCQENQNLSGQLPHGVSYVDNFQIDNLQQSFSGLDLVAQCNSHNYGNDDYQSTGSNENLSSQELVPDQDMGQKSSLLTGHSRSKVSLTWVLRERSDIKYNPCNNKVFNERNDVLNNSKDTNHRFQRNEHSFDRNIIKNDNEYYDSRNDSYSSPNADRIVGRNAKQFKCFGSEINRNTTKCKKSIASYNNYPDSWSESQEGFKRNSSGKKHRHRKRRSKTVEKQTDNFGYEIKDIDSFLSEASIDNPGNIPVVVTYPSILYQTRSGNYQKELSLSLGMVVNAVFKNKQWLYVQTPHGEEGYILYASCLPLGILPPIHRSQASWKTAPCWESTLDLYPQPCGNMTDSEKEQLRGGTKSECGRSRPKSNYYEDTMSAYSEKTFDKLYLKATTSCPKLKEIYNDNISHLQSPESKMKQSVYKKRQWQKENNAQVSHTTRHTLLVVESDYEGSKSINTLTVQKGDVVILVQGDSIEADVDSEWFYVRNKDGGEGFIPAVIAGHGYL
ncbi:uncharacterized protein LOC143913183 [Arctopsyche grandis]|uniref:uncharacterized protein LOC143913183 n=1 Tax=Arctopsyche grandis TaxID=121162 RepID=UPI00406D9383